MKNFPYTLLVYNRLKISIVVLTLIGIFAIHSCNPVDPSIVSIKFTPDIPVDVNPELQAKLKAENDFYALDEAFNDYSWKAFVAINWPRDAEGNPTPNFTDKGTATWLGWKEAFQVYRADGKKPAAWGLPRTATGLGLHPDIIKDVDARAVLSDRTPTMGKNIADEVDQAFAGKLYDQNGNVVVYEVLMNEAEFNYIVDNSLYNINGQLAFSKSNPEANFPKGDYDSGVVGATEIKFAWKILEAGDIKERYYIDEGYIVNQQTGNLEKKTLGMIGMHISQKTPTGKQWVWSTFEHIDNLDQNVTVVDGKRKIIHPTLTDPDCEICPVNLDLSSDTATYNSNNHGDYWDLTTDTFFWYTNTQKRKTQSKRIVDIPVRVQNINAKMQAYFKSVNSVWQYYQLIDTQYPRNQDAPPSSHQEASYKIPESVNNKPGGDPNLALLTNITMETFFQKGNQNAANLMEANPPTNFHIYGSESCMGCHSSAGIYDHFGKSSSNPDSIVAQTGVQLTADFSWLMGKAKWLDNIPVIPATESN